HRLQLVEAFLREIHSLPLNIFEIGCPADGGFLSLGTAVHTIDNPLEDAHVFPETRPQESALRLLAEPVHMKDARGRNKTALHLDPMPEVAPHVISAEWHHRHRIAWHFRAFPSGGRFGF